MTNIGAINILGVGISTYTLPSLLDFFTHTINDQQKAIVAYANIHAINLAQELPWFHDFLSQADVVYCDGFGVRVGAILLGQQPPPRYTPPDWIPQLCQVCVENDFSLFFLGARQRVCDMAVASLLTRFPGLKIVGSHHGYFDKTLGSYENEYVIKQINDVKPNILILGLGMPLQERWLIDNWSKINSNIALTGGAVFDYISGNIGRAPRWMTDHGLEWLGRLIIEPRRLWKRYLIGNPLFILRVLRYRWSKGSHSDK